MPDKYTAVARRMIELPNDKVRSVVRPQVAAALGSTVSEMFPEFARSFPLTVASMERHWSKPILSMRDMGASWLPNLFLERPDLNLFLHDPHPIYVDDPSFDVSMLPPAWGGLYRSMESFVITDKSYYSPLGWPNTLLPDSGLNIDEYSNETHTKKSKLKAFSKRLGIDVLTRLRCYLFSDAKDSLWIDAQHRDQKVYHVRADAFEDAHVLPNPGATLDQYLAHVVAGGAPKDFDFRGGLPPAH